MGLIGCIDGSIPLDVVYSFFAKKSMRDLLRTCSSGL